MNSPKAPRRRFYVEPEEDPTAVTIKELLCAFAVIGGVVAGICGLITWLYL